MDARKTKNSKARRRNDVENLQPHIASIELIMSGMKDGWFLATEGAFWFPFC